MLAICDVVIINVKDEISDRMRKTIDICKSSLSNLENNKMPKPDVFFVQNQKANLHSITFLIAFFNISIIIIFSDKDIQFEAMRSILEGSDQETLRLSNDMFVALPSAFNTIGIQLFNAIYCLPPINKM